MSQKNTVPYLPTDAALCAAFVAGYHHVMVSDEQHREDMLEHYKRISANDATYARWCCGALARDNPEIHGDLLTRFDAWMVEQKRPKPPTFSEWSAKLRVVL